MIFVHKGVGRLHGRSEERRVEVAPLGAKETPQRGVSTEDAPVEHGSSPSIGFDGPQASGRIGEHIVGP